MTNPHSHPGQTEPRAHGETLDENRILDLNTVSNREMKSKIYRW